MATSASVLPAEFTGMSKGVRMSSSEVYYFKELYFWLEKTSSLDRNEVFAKFDTLPNPYETLPISKNHSRAPTL
jgi:hypothetical protein